MRNLLFVLVAVTACEPRIPAPADAGHRPPAAASDAGLVVNDEALETFRSLAESAKTAKGWRNYGDALATRKQNAEAVTAYERCVTMTEVAEESLYCQAAIAIAKKIQH